MAYRPMTAAELAEHKTQDHGRDYRLSDDGYGDMEVAEKRGWRVVSGWGRDGWDLGSWPYVAMYFRESNDGRTDADGKLVRIYELQQIVEGDHTAYSFDTPEDRERAVDYMFLWYAAGEDWAPLDWEDRERLDRGELTVDEKFRGPYRNR